jgi:hypothetical protein
MPHGFCGRLFEEHIVGYLPEPFDDILLQRIAEITPVDLRFPCSRNRELRPVIQNTKIRSPMAIASTLVISGTPYAVGPFRQFLTPVRAVFNRLESNHIPHSEPRENLISWLLNHNLVLRAHFRQRLNAARDIVIAALDEPDESMNIAILNPCCNHIMLRFWRNHTNKENLLKSRRYIINSCISDLSDWF